MANNISKGLINEITAHKETKDKLRKKEIEYTQVVEQLKAMTLDRDYHKERYQKLQKGATIYWEANGYIYNAINLEGYFNTTYPQVIPSDIKLGYYKVVNGSIELDKDKKKQIRGGL